ncbi:MAG: hypothetical protein ABIE94_04505 [archaeon]
MVNRDEVLAYVKRKGPSIPNDIKKELGTDTFVIGAILSELKDKGHIKVSSTKIGGSPTYYAPGQEYQLERLRKWLNEKDQRAFDLLKEKKVLRDYEQVPLVRVSLRTLKDFAKALEVKIGENTEIFWKWHVLPTSEAEQMIKDILMPVKEEAPSPAEPASALRNQEVSGALETKSVSNEPPKAPEPKKEEKKEPEKRSEPAPSAEPEKKVLKEVDDTGDAFMKKLKSYFEEKRIRIIEKIKVKKNSQAEFIVDLPTAVGRMEYYCQAKKKKKCNDGDLSSAYITGQAKKMPVLFITTGDLTKKAESMLYKEFKGMVVKKI